MKIVIAYSGGLDTSVALRWLREKYNAEIIAFCANLGQFEDLNELEQKALSTGASKVYVENHQSTFLSDYCFKALQAGAAYERQYLLAAPLGRPLIAKRMVEIAHAENAEAVAHGASGKGNDQVRFYSSVIALDPSLRVLAPLIEWDMKSREEEIDYARQYKIPLPEINENSPYSVDTNIWGSSIECGPLDDLGNRPHQDVYQITVDPENAPSQSEVVEIGFKRGIPVSLNKQMMNSVELVQALNKIGGKHGVGRIDILENRVVGIKTRGVYESPGGILLHSAHRELQSLVLDRDTLHFKEGVSQKYSDLIYNGLWFSPLREMLDSFVEQTQHNVTGQIALRLYKGHISIESRNSNFALYDDSLSTYESTDEFHHLSGEGFAYVWSLPLRIAHIAARKKRIED